MNLKSSSLCFAFFVFASINVKADDNREAFHTAMEACFAETGVTRAERGTRPSEEDRNKIEACLQNKGIEKPERGSGRRAEFKAAKKSCVSQYGDEDRTKIDDCLEEKGFQKPQGRKQ
jgi:hypothetical protein